MLQCPPVVEAGIPPARPDLGVSIGTTSSVRHQNYKETEMENSKSFPIKYTDESRGIGQRKSPDNDRGGPVNVGETSPLKTPERTPEHVNTGKG